jgi:hypothetical protein
MVAVATVGLGCVVAPQVERPAVDDDNPTPNDNTAIRFARFEDADGQSRIGVTALRQTGTLCKIDLPNGLYYGSCPAVPSQILEIQCFPADACRDVRRGAPSRKGDFVGAEGSVVPVASALRVRVTADFAGDVEVREVAYPF